MFAVNCPTVHTRVLIRPSDVTAITNTADGVYLHFTCSCGQAAVLHTGRHAAREVLHHPQPQLSAAA